MPKIYVVGMDGSGALSNEARRAFESAASIIVSPRLMDIARANDSFAPFIDKCIVLEHVTDTIAQIRQAQDNIAVIATGDPLFFGIGRKILDEFADRKIEIIPALSSIQLACARVRIPWHDALFVSLHGPSVRKWKREDLSMLLETHSKLIILTGGENTPRAIAGQFDQSAVLYVLERLGYEDEAVIKGSPSEIAGRDFSSPNLMIALGPKSTSAVMGLSENEFRHERGLITKDEIRAVALHKLTLPREGVLWDIGAGSGSVSIEAKRIAPSLDIYAIEKDPSRAGDIRYNAHALKTSAVNIIEGLAPSALTTLPAPDRVFVGGSGGDLSEIISHVSDRMEHGVIVVTTILIENTNEALTALKSAGFEVDAVSISVSRAEPLEGKTYMKAMNTVFVITGRR